MKEEQIMTPHMYQRTKARTMEPWMHETRLVQALTHATADICRHRLCESEKAGHDIGWDRAVVDWTLRFGHDFHVTSER